ncbi:MAG: hypothetical protein ACTSVY_03130 [Candidatus Helarchaeota archaeon]
MTSLSIRTEKKIIEELDRLARLQNLDRTSIVRKILKRGIEKEKLELAITLYISGESIERATDISQCNFWDILSELKKRGIMKHFDLDAEKEIILNTIAKDNPDLKKKILEIK